MTRVKVKKIKYKVKQKPAKKYYLCEYHTYTPKVEVEECFYCAQVKEEQSGKPR